MSTITSIVHVDAPPDTTFERFTDFTDYKNFMHSVDTVRVDDHGYVHFRYSIGPIPREFVIEVTTDPTTRTLSWTSVRGPEHSGTATITEQHHGSELNLHAEFAPHGALESTGDNLGVIQSRVDKDLRRFAA